MSRRGSVEQPGKKRNRGWIVLAVIVGIAVLGGLLGRAALPVLVIAIVAAVALGLWVVLKGATPRLGMHSRRSGFVALGAAALLFIGGAAGAADLPTDVDTSTALKIAAPTESDTAERVPTPTPKPTTFESVDVDIVVPFERTTVDDATLEKGKTAVTTAGVDGTKRET